MSKVLAPILFFIVAVGLFFSYLKPAYSELNESKIRLEKIDLAIKESEQLLKNYEALLQANSSIPAQDRKNLFKILPDAVDSVRLILDIDALATKHKLDISSFKVPELESSLLVNRKKPSGKSNSNSTDQDSPLGEAVLTIECTGTYEDFKPFLLDIERSMSLMDVVSLEIKVGEQSEPGTEGENTFTLGLQTYWLKETK